MLSRRHKYILLKIFSMFSVIRGKNIALIIIAQYLTSIFIMAPEKPVKTVLFDTNLFLLVLATAAVVASGFIINNFYDAEKDFINRPQKSIFERLVSQNTKLYCYFVLNALVIIFAFYVSFRAVFFFSTYILAIWIYCHKLKKQPIVGNLTSAILTITPFFAIFLYFKNLKSIIFIFGIFLFLLLSLHELVKDLKNIKGDLALNYKTIPVVYGERTSKLMAFILVVANIVTAIYLLKNYDLNNMVFFFYGSIAMLIVILFLLISAIEQAQFARIHLFIKFLIMLGVFSIVLLP